MASTELTHMTARQTVDLLKKGEVTTHDLLDALEARIDQVNHAVNALPTTCFDRARRAADTLADTPMAQRGVLAGLPVPIKDLLNVAGTRSTQGSLIFCDHVPEDSDLTVHHLEANGAVVYAKSNTPEFGAGANTFNDVFGATLNPWNTALSAAGSSGGAAVALATGMAWLAHGSDMGGSLRNPASFCGVTGMRPSPGRVAKNQNAGLGGLLSVEGPMARNVEDLALMLNAMAGECAGDPLSLPDDGTDFVTAARFGPRPGRVALSLDLGITPVDPEVADVVTAAARSLESEGVVVELAHPDLSEAHDCFQILRAAAFAASLSPLLETHREHMKPEVIWNIEKGLALDYAQVVKAEKQRVDMYHRVLNFFDTYDLLLTPATIVAPFPVEQRYVEACGEHRFSNYVEWLAIAYAITNVACPALSIPAGFTASGLPVGLQVVGPPRGDAQAIAGAWMLEQTIGLGAITPINPATGSRMETNT